MYIRLVSTDNSKATNFNPLEHNIIMTNIQKFSSYLTENTRFNYDDQSVDVT
jgi:hypothetical protein